MPECGPEHFLSVVHAVVSSELPPRSVSLHEAHDWRPFLPRPALENLALLSSSPRSPGPSSQASHTHPVRLPGGLLCRSQAPRAGN